MQASHCELVLENCDRALSLNSRYVKALLRRFKMHQTLGHKEEALLGMYCIHTFKFVFFPCKT